MRGALSREKSSLLQLETYRSLLLSHLSLADTVAALRLVGQPEVFADPPAFDLASFLRTEAEQEEFEAKLERPGPTRRLGRSKPLLDRRLQDEGLDPQRTVCFASDCPSLVSAAKQYQSTLLWHHTSSRSARLFHLQMQPSESVLIEPESSIDYPTTMQNHFSGASRALAELHSAQVKAGRWVDLSHVRALQDGDYLRTPEEGSVVLLRQWLLVTSLFPAKAYSNQHRMFEVADTKRLLTQSQLQQLFPYEQFPAFSVAETLQLILATLQRGIKQSEHCF